MWSRLHCVAGATPHMARHGVRLAHFTGAISDDPWALAGPRGESPHPCFCFVLGVLNFYDDFFCIFKIYLFIYVLFYIFIVVQLQSSQFFPIALPCPACSFRPPCCPCPWVLYTCSLTISFPFFPCFPSPPSGAFMSFIYFYFFELL